MADVQASGFTPISWLRFSSRTALTTTCTASNIRAADSWGDRTGKRQLSQGAPKPSDSARPSRNVESSRRAVRTGLWGPFSGKSGGSGKNVRAAHASVGAALPESRSHAPVWGTGTSERVCLDGQLGHLHTEVSVGLRACPGICVCEADAGAGRGPDWGGACRLDTHDCLSIQRGGVASRDLGGR